MAQRLVRSLCESCKEQVRVSEAVLRNVGFPFDLWRDKPMAFHKPSGCERCWGNGYSGRIGVYGLMAVTDEGETLDLSRSSADERGRAATRAGMVRMRADGLLKAPRGATPHRGDTAHHGVDPAGRRKQNLNLKFIRIEFTRTHR